MGEVAPLLPALPLVAPPLVAPPLADEVGVKEEFAEVEAAMWPCDAEVAMGPAAGAIVEFPGVVFDVATIPTLDDVVMAVLFIAGAVELPVVVVGVAVGLPAVVVVVAPTVAAVGLYGGGGVRTPGPL